MKKKIFIDANIWLRFLLRDKEKQYQACKKLFTLNEKGKFKLYTSTIVLLEIIYILNTFYRIPKKQIISDVKSILIARNLTLLEKTNFPKALSLFKKYQIKLADCLIASQLPPETILCTYDQDFQKIKNLFSLTPEKITKQNNAN